MEWLVSAEFETVGLSALRRALDAREKLLRFGTDRAPMRTLQIVPSRPEPECVTRAALLFASLGEVFGLDAMRRFLQTVSDAKQWSGCLTAEELGNTLFGATNSLVSSRCPPNCTPAPQRTCSTASRPPRPCRCSGSSSRAST